MTPEQKQVYEWAKEQNFQSVAARYAKILAEMIEDLIAQVEKVEKQRDAAQALLAEMSDVTGCNKISTCFGYPLDKVRQLVESHKLFSGVVFPDTDPVWANSDVNPVALIFHQLNSSVDTSTVKSGMSLQEKLSMLKDMSEASGDNQTDTCLREIDNLLLDLNPVEISAQIQMGSLNQWLKRWKTSLESQMCGLLIQK